MAPLRGFVRRLAHGYQRLLENEAQEQLGTGANPPIVVNRILQIKTAPVVKETVIERQGERQVQAFDMPGRRLPFIGVPIPKQPEEEKPKEEHEENAFTGKGVPIPKFANENIPLPKSPTQEHSARLDLTYPLIPKKPMREERVMAYARIFWDDKQSKYIYQVNEPAINAEMRDVILKVKEILEQRLDIEFNQMKKFESMDYLQKQIDDILGYLRLKLTEDDKKVLHYYIQRDFIGLERVEPLLQDEQIEDISCDGLGIPIFVFHRNPMLGSLMTNVTFHDNDELDSFVMRLSQLTGKSVSMANPLLSGALPDGSRIQAMLATDIARRGSNFTIRKFTEEPLTPIHLLNYGTIDVKTIAYLWMVLDYGKSILISGGTATGKTTVLNVLSLFIRPEKKIVSIEDTPELKLPHPHWVPSVARTAISVVESKKIGEIDLFDLLRESLRQRPDYIIVGEVRGREAYVLFQEMATGHPSLATIHAENMPKLLDRLTTPPIELPPGLIESANVIVFLLATRYKGKQTRRVGSVLEVVGLDANKNPITNEVFKWNPITDTFDIQNNSMMLKNISDATGMSVQDITEEFKRRMLLLEWMRMRNISNYRDVNSVINIYYSSPDRVMSSISPSMQVTR
jgi:flagellar protein FlaI